MARDIGIWENGQVFRYRAAAIIIENGCVLFAGNEKSDYYYSIGGAVEMGETAEEAVKREVFEETGIEYQVDRPVVIHENFFTENGARWHEVALYFLMKPRGTMELNACGYTQGVPEKMFWLPADRLGEYKAYPAFLADMIGDLPTDIRHIVTVE